MVLGAMIVGGMVGNYAARRQFESMSAAQVPAVGRETRLKHKGSSGSTRLIMAKRIRYKNLRN